MLLIKQTSLTEVVKEYALIKEMSCRPLNIKINSSQNVQFVTALLEPLNKKLIEQNLLMNMH